MAHFLQMILGNTNNSPDCRDCCKNSIVFIESNLQFFGAGQNLRAMWKAGQKKMDIPSKQCTRKSVESCMFTSSFSNTGGTVPSRAFIFSPSNRILDAQTTVSTSRPNGPQVGPTTGIYTKKSKHICLRGMLFSVSIPEQTNNVLSGRARVPMFCK